MKTEFTKSMRRLTVSGIMVMGLGLHAKCQIQFEEITDADIEMVFQSSVAFSDVDQDGDEDLLITGTIASLQTSTNLYTNDGGTFTLVENAPFDNVRLGSIAFSNVDGGGAENVLITGINAQGDRVSKFYTNNSGSFTLADDIPFEGVIRSSIAFSDIDNDGDNDVLITGGMTGGETISNLYTYAEGNFTLVETTPFPGVQFSSIAFSDVDGDGDEDVLITGTSSLGSIANLYTNEGGSFALIEGTPFEAVTQSSIAFSDIDSDGDEDVLITGQNSSSQRVANLYTNDGGVFTVVENTPFAGVYEGSVAFADMDGDGDDDLLITGDTAINRAVSNVYENDSGSFTLVENTSIEAAFGGSVAFSDIDGDGDLDLIVTGQSLSEAAISKLYRNITMPNGIAEAERKSFSIAPNPTSGMAAIDLSQIGTGRIDLSVFDLNGKQVHQESLMNAGSTLTVDFSEMEIGVYLVSIQNRYGEKFTSKLVTIE